MKTYILMILGALASVLLGAEIIGAKTYAWIMGLLATGGGAALRHSISKTEKKVDRALTNSEIAANAATEAAAKATIAAKGKSHA